ncbi:hypothetical protein PFISCL1PPCAC_12844, partial [Pristionchus fissidentatus]
GCLILLVSSMVAVLILMDEDPRGKAYRKYLVALQISSMAMDCWTDVYSPILQVNCRIIFSNSKIAEIFDVPSFFGGFIFLLGLLANAYFNCVYYRRT